MGSKTKKGGQKGKLSQAEIEQTYAALIAGTDPILNARMPKFPFRFHVLVDETGRRLLLKEGPGEVVCRQAPQGLISELLTYSSRCGLAAFALSHSKAAAVANYVTDATPPLAEMPRPIRFKSDRGLIYHRLPFDILPTVDRGAFPTWSEIGSRMGNFRAFCMWIGSLLHGEGSRKQVVYLWGPKNSSKSAIQAALISLFGPSAFVIGNTELRSAHWKPGLVGKVLVIVPEATAAFLNRDEFKSITGDDLHAINEKHQPIVNVVINARLLFVSNDPPVTGMDDAVTERIIPCEMAALSIPTSSLIEPNAYQAKLRLEFPAFLAHCIAEYGPHKGSWIPVEEPLEDKYIVDWNASIGDFYTEYFVRDSDSKMLRTEFRTICESRWPGLSNKDFSEILRYGVTNRLIISRKMTTKLVDSDLESGNRRLFVVGLRKRTRDERPVAIVPV